MRKQVDTAKGFDAMAAMLESIKVAVKENTVTLTGEVKPTIWESMVADGPLVWMIYSEQQKLNAPGRAVESVPPAPAE